VLTSSRRCSKKQLQSKGVISMAKRHWENREKMKARIGSEGAVGHICWVLGVIFAVLGIIADVANVTLGLVFNYHRP